MTIAAVLGFEKSPAQKMWWFLQVHASWHQLMSVVCCFRNGWNNTAKRLLVSKTKVFWCRQNLSERLPYKNSGGVLVWLSFCSEVQICICPSWCHCHSVSLASVNPDWFYLSGTGSPRMAHKWLLYWLTRVVPDSAVKRVCVSRTAQGDFFQISDWYPIPLCFLTCVLSFV